MCFLGTSRAHLGLLHQQKPPSSTFSFGCSLEEQKKGNSKKQCQGGRGSWSRPCESFSYLWVRKSTVLKGNPIFMSDLDFEETPSRNMSFQLVSIPMTQPSPQFTPFLK